MSEQPGRAAGTAEPNQASIQPSNFNQPWSISGFDPRVIVDANGGTVALTIASPFNESPNPADPAEVARRIVACVNLCVDLNTRQMEGISASRYYRISAQAISQEEFDEIAANGMTITGGLV